MNLKFSKTYWLSIITFLERLIPFILLPILLNDLGVADYGVLYLILTVVSFFLPIFSFGFNLFFSKEYNSINENIFKKIFSNFLIIQFLLLLFFSTLILILYTSNIIKLDFFDLLILLILPSFKVVNLAVKEILRIRKNIKESAFIALLIFLLDVIITLVLLKDFNFGFKSRIYGTSIALTLSSIIALIYFRNYIQFSVNKYYLKKWYLFGKQIIVYRISGFLLNQGDRFIIQIILGEFFLGLYIISLQVASPFLILMKAISSGWNSFLYDFQKRKLLNFTYLIKVNFIFIFILIFGLIVYQIILNEIFDSIITKVTISEIFYFQLILCITYITQTLYNINFPVIIFRGQQKFIAKISLISAFINIILNLLLILYFKTILVACIMFLVNWIFMYLTSSRKIYSILKSG